MDLEKNREYRKQFNIKVGLKMSQLRSNSGITQEKLAEIVGISTKYIGHIEQGRKGMSLYVAKGVAKALGVTLEELVKGI